MRCRVRKKVIWPIFSPFQTIPLTHLRGWGGQGVTKKRFDQFSRFFRPYPTEFFWSKQLSWPPHIPPHTPYCMMPSRVSQKIQKSEFWNMTYLSGFHRLDEIFSGKPTWPYCARPNMLNMAKYAKYAYLGARNMVKWGVPEKILQNAVQTRWS